MENGKKTDKFRIKESERGGGGELDGVRADGVEWEGNERGWSWRV